MGVMKSLRLRPTCFAILRPCRAVLGNSIDCQHRLLDYTGQTMFTDLPLSIVDALGCACLHRGSLTAVHPRYQGAAAELCADTELKTPDRTG
jgi:hypothetical protein